MIHRTLKQIAVPMVVLGGLAACAPVYSVPHGGQVRADTARGTQQVFRTRDGRIFSTRAARDAYLARIDARERELYQQEVRQQRRTNRQQRRAEQDAQLLREERRLQRIERERALAQQRHAEADRAERQARRDARRAERARQQQQDLETTRQNRIRAERAAIEAERRAQRQLRRDRQITRRQQRVDDLAPRQRLAPAVRKKVQRYASYRRSGENMPAFVTRIAEAERLSSRRGQTVAYWLNDRNRNQRRGASDR